MTAEGTLREWPNQLARSGVPVPERGVPTPLGLMQGKQADRGRHVLRYLERPWPRSLTPQKVRRRRRMAVGGWDGLLVCSQGRRAAGSRRTQAGRRGKPASLRRPDGAVGRSPEDEAALGFQRPHTRETTILDSLRSPE